MGFGTVRASSSRGSVAGLKEMLRVGKTTNLTITPDGPRGPRGGWHTVAFTYHLRLQIPLVCVGFGCDRPGGVTKAWDQSAIARPFSRVRMVRSRPIQIPADVDRGEIEEHRSTCSRYWSRERKLLSVGRNLTCVKAMSCHWRKSQHRWVFSTIKLEHGVII